MALSALDDKARKPRPADLAETLGRSYTHWKSLAAHLDREFPPLTQEWNFSGAKWGWSMRLKQKKRTVLYMTPCKAHFLVGFVLGEKAVKAALESDLPDSILTVIDEAKKYAEGRGVRIEIRNTKDLKIIKGLAEIKMAN